MIVSCSRCSSRYRVSEDKLPTSGGNIQCPSCGHVFFVEPPKPAAELLQALPEGAEASVEDDGMPTTVGMTAAQLLAGAQGVAAPVPDLSERPQVKGDAWKLKTSFGLVYDFPDTASLQAWLSGREDLDGYLLSRDGTDYKALDQHREVMTPALRAKITAAAAGLTRKPAPVPSASNLAARGAEPAAPEVKKAEPRTSSEFKKPEPRTSAEFKKPEVNQELAKSVEPVSAPGGKAKAPKGPSSRTSAPARPAARPKPRPRGGLPVEEKPNRLPLLIGVVVVLLIGAATLHFTGVVNLGRLFKGRDAAPVAQGNGRPASAPAGPEAPPLTLPPPPADPGGSGEDGPGSLSPFSQDGHIRSLIQQAEQEMGAREYDQAIATLESARNLAPDNPEIFRLLERAWSRQGDREKAREARERYEALEASP